ncbi:unnamed protein product [Auanema sp. JU1783]|nr:unnamed protein product [Auanema sp. JU1783]
MDKETKKTTDGKSQASSAKNIVEVDKQQESQISDIYKTCVFSVNSTEERPTGGLISLDGSEEKKLNVNGTKETNVSRKARKSSRSSSRTQSLKKIPRGIISHIGSLEDEAFYHGYLSREATERLLTKDGEFLVRRGEVLNEECYLISVRHNNEVKHLRILLTRSGRHYWVSQLCFESVGELIRYHQQNKLPVHGDNILLQYFVKREVWQLNHEQVTLGEKIGSGQFGEVYAGTLAQGIFTRDVKVAVKTLNSGHLSADDRVTFLQEANLMLKLKHKHVIHLYGVATQKKPIMIFCILCGSLLQRIQEKTSTIETKRRYCKEIVSGMSYVESQQVIHRDLAARNVLLTKSDSCKISDFGLSLLGKIHKENMLKNAPVRWLAPESLLQGCYSSKSDVWSFGVVMYEVFSNGKVPYDQHDNLKKLATAVVKDGLRLQPPEEMSELDRSIMQMCFAKNTDDRASFEDLREKYNSNNTTHIINSILKTKKN